MIIIWLLLLFAFNTYSKKKKQNPPCAVVTFLQKRHVWK